MASPRPSPAVNHFSGENDPSALGVLTDTGVLLFSCFLRRWSSETCVRVWTLTRIPMFIFVSANLPQPFVKPRVCADPADPGPGLVQPASLAPSRLLPPTTGACFSSPAGDSLTRPNPGYAQFLHCWPRLRKANLLSRTQRGTPLFLPRASRRPVGTPPPAPTRGGSFRHSVQRGVILRLRQRLIHLSRAAFHPGFSPCPG